VVEKLSQGSPEFWKTVSAERSSTLKSDVLVTYGETGKDEAKIVSNKLFGQIPAIKSGARVFLVDKTDALTMSAPSPLAVPWFLDKIVPQIAAAAAKAG
jgi:iron complex transport system substrate-binding protein